VNMPNKSKTPQLDALVDKTPDLVDRIFDYLVEVVPVMRDHAEELKAEVRAEFGGGLHYVQADAKLRQSQRMQDILRLFNGRNPTEVARALGISRPTVYRYLKQAGSMESTHLPGTR
jgi:Mor family transcriptional regulator